MTHDQVGKERDGRPGHLHLDPAHHASAVRIGADPLLVTPAEVSDGRVLILHAESPVAGEPLSHLSEWDGGALVLVVAAVPDLRRLSGLLGVELLPELLQRRRWSVPSRSC